MPYPWDQLNEARGGSDDWDENKADIDNKLEESRKLFEEPLASQSSFWTNIFCFIIFIGIIGLLVWWIFF